MASLRLKPVSWGARPVRLTDEPVTIGRHPDNQIRLKDEKASRFHCVVEPDSDGYRIRDLNSRNGVKLNGERIGSAMIADGDTIVVGSSEFMVEAVSDDASITEAPVRRGHEPPWARELRHMIEILPPKTDREEAVQLIDARGERSEALASDGEGPTATRLLLQAASKAHATDIHLEPKIEHAGVAHARGRADGLDRRAAGQGG